MPKGGRKGLTDWLEQFNLMEQATEIALRAGLKNEQRADEITVLLRQAGGTNLVVSAQQVQRFIAQLSKSAIEPAMAADKRIAKKVTRVAMSSLAGLQQDLEEIENALKALMTPGNAVTESNGVRIIKDNPGAPNVYEYTALVKARTDLRKIIAQLTVTGLKPELVAQYLMTQRDALEEILSPRDFASVMDRLRTHPDLAPLMTLMGWHEPEEPAGPEERAVM